MNTVPCQLSNFPDQLCEKLDAIVVIREEIVVEAMKSENHTGSLGTIRSLGLYLLAWKTWWTRVKKIRGP